MATFFKQRPLAFKPKGLQAAAFTGLLSAFGCIGTANATLTDSLTIGNAHALSMGHAVTADPPGIDSIHYNPAGLARLKGTQRHIKLLAADFSIELNFGEYGESQQTRVDRAFDLVDAGESGLSRDDLYDEAHRSSSQTEGATAMIPVAGMVDLPIALAPLAGFSYRPEGANYTVGTNVYTPMFLGFNRSPDDPGRFMGEQLSLSLITYFSPTIAYEFTDSLTVGASVNFSYAGVGLNLSFREPHDMLFWTQTPEFRDLLCANDGEATLPALDTCAGFSPYGTMGILKFEVDQPMVVGYNLGALWEPTDWITFGIAYNSSIKLDMEGDFEFPTTPEFREFFTTIIEGGFYQGASDVTSLIGLDIPGADSVGHPQGTASVQLEMPEHWAVGTSVRVTPSLKVNFDVKWTGWSSFAGIPVEFDQEIGLLQLAVLADQTGNADNLATATSLVFPLGLQDTWNWSLGLEYQYSDRLVLRAGIEDRPSATPVEARSPLVPLDEGTLYGMGFGYKWKKGFDIDFGVGYFTSSLEMPACTSKLGNSCNSSQVIYNPYIGTDIDSDLSAFLVEFMFKQVL